MELIKRLRDESLPLDIIIGYLVLEIEKLEKIIKEKDETIAKMIVSCDRIETVNPAYDDGNEIDINADVYTPSQIERTYEYFCEYL